MLTPYLSPHPCHPRYLTPRTCQTVPYNPSPILRPLYSVPCPCLVRALSHQHMYDFSEAAPKPGDFFAMITADQGGDVKVWNWKTASWQSNGPGRCNSDGHSQWNCSPKEGVRFHYPSRWGLNRERESEREREKERARE